MIPAIAVPMLYSLAGKGLTEHAEKREWTGALTRRFRNKSHGGILQKQNPLPVGRYWIDVFEDGIPDWIGWSGGNLATVHVEKTEFYKGTNKILEVLGWVYPWVPGDNTVVPDRAFIIFNVSSPTNWGVEAELGWPNIAPPNIQTSDDTVKKPVPEDTLPWWQGGNQGLPEVKLALTGVAIAGGILAAAYVFRSFR